LAEVIVIFADNSLQGSVLISEHNCTSEETTYDTVYQASSGEEKPVKIVSLPVLLEEHSFLDDPLFFCCVKTAGIN